MQYIDAPEPQEMSLRNTFRALCAVTTPHGHEAYTWPLIPGYKYVDKSDNVHVLVTKADGEYPNTMFSSHCDTVGHSMVPVVMTEKGGIIRTDGHSILGADCKIGVALMIKMIYAAVPGWYVFHAGEEKGCIGSKWLAKHPEHWPLTPNKCVAFDRYGYTSVITHQARTRTASDAFANALAAQLVLPDCPPYEPDDGGVYTDSNSYRNLIPECTNVSVGYFNQHRHNECQDIEFAERLLKALIKVDWENLPAERDPTKDETPKYSHPSWYRGDYNWKGGEDDDDHHCFPLAQPDDPKPSDPQSAARFRVYYSCCYCNRTSAYWSDEEAWCCNNCGFPIDDDEYDEAVALGYVEWQEEGDQPASFNSDSWWDDNDPFAQDGFNTDNNLDRDIPPDDYEEGDGQCQRQDGRGSSRASLVQEPGTHSSTPLLMAQRSAALKLERWTRTLSSGSPASMGLEMLHQ